MSARVFLIGYRGTGKSTVARLLADRLGWNWCDADAVLEATYGKTIRQIFADEGETGFRDKESAVLVELAQRERCVIATGGGVVLRPENRAQLERGRVFWLHAPPDVIWQRLQADASTGERRPNLAQGGLEEIVELIEKREPLYRACAERRLDTGTRSPADIAEEIATIVSVP
jgi:shikimate kinase